MRYKNRKKKEKKEARLLFNKVGKKPWAPKKS